MPDIGSHARGRWANSASHGGGTPDETAEASVKETGLRNGAHDEKFGFKNLAAVHWNLLDTALVEHAIANREGSLVRRRV